MPRASREARLEYGRKWRLANPGYASKRSKAWAEANPDAKLENRYKSTYGISLADYDQMFEAQQGRCGICGTDKAGGRWNGRLHVDHSHATGRVRGLLCAGCNIGLGGFADNTAALARAIAYLTDKESQ